MDQSGDLNMKPSFDETAIIEDLSHISQDQMIDRIKQISLSAWDNYLEMNTLRAWLNNFKGDALGSAIAEQVLALWIVQNFVLYTDRDVRAMCKNLWWKYIHHLLESYEKEDFMGGASTEEKYAYIVNNTIIQPLGNCSGSGTNIAYFFRQSNGIAASHFDLSSKDGKYRYLVLIDDATLSGRQAEENLEHYRNITGKEKLIITLISTQKAKDYLKGKATLISSVELDEKSKCFSENSYVFARKREWQELTKKMCKYYGGKIDPYNSLGYRNGQYILGFYYNIPNNSLPILWGTLNKWTPLFIRYYSNEKTEEVFDNEKYV